MESVHIRVYELKRRNRSKYGLWEGERSLTEKEEAGNIRRRSAVFMIMVVHVQGLRS
jgi:hypothetical protein